jgi:hypothetical protein
MDPTASAYNFVQILRKKCNGDLAVRGRKNEPYTESPKLAEIEKR